MLLTALRGELNFPTAIAGIFACLIIIFIVMPLHEFAHAFTANLCGDKTSKMLGRVSFNPLRHIDPIGAALILLVGFGWAKPVPVNVNAMRKPRLHSALVSLAGPLSNFIAALIGAFAFNIIYVNYIMGNISGDIIYYIIVFFSYFISINVSLAVFNILPIPPLDGSKILYACLPNRILYKFQRYETYISLALMFLCLMGVLSVPLNYLCSGVTNMILNFSGNIVLKFF